jgi:hypothetical protein
MQQVEPGTRLLRVNLEKEIVLKECADVFCASLYCPLDQHLGRLSLPVLVHIFI